MKPSFLKASLSIVLFIFPLYSQNTHAMVRHALDCDFNEAVYYPHILTMTVQECDAGLLQCRADLGPAPVGEKCGIWKRNDYKCIKGWDRCMSALPSPPTAEEKHEAEAFDLDNCSRNTPNRCFP